MQLNLSKIMHALSYSFANEKDNLKLRKQVEQHLAAFKDMGLESSDLLPVAYAARLSMALKLR